MHLTDEQRQAAIAGHAARIVDHDNHIEFVLIRADTYAKMLQSLQVEEFDPSFFEADDEEARAFPCSA